MCLDDQILNTYLDGELAEPWKSQVEEHLSYCSSCRTRYQNLIKLSQVVKGAELTEDEIKPRQDRVLSMIEKNYLSKGKGRKSFLHKTFKLTAPQLVGVAAAFVVVFVGSWAVFGNNSGGSTILMPDVNTTIDLNNITQTRSTDNAATSKSLESYSVDEILKNLDARGYDVEVRLKSIQPLSLGKMDSQVRVIATIPSKDITITSDGLAKGSDGSIVATGLRLDDSNQIVASDGTVIFTSDLVTPEEVTE